MSEKSIGVRLTFDAEFKFTKKNCVGGLYDRKWTGNYIPTTSAVVLTMLIRFLIKFNDDRQNFVIWKDLEDRFLGGFMFLRRFKN